MKNKLYLRPDVYFEPLFNNWYAWPYLLAPATAAMNFTNHHLRLMKSFVANAKIHAQAVTAKMLTGSSLMDCTEAQAADISDLLARSQVKMAELIGFANDIQILDTLLKEHARGETLVPLYKLIPARLKGYVELVYDLNNQPSIRFIEGLLYKSPHFRRDAQSLCFGDLNSDDRPFVLSTPRLPDGNHLHIQVPFDHEFVTALFRMRETAADLSELKEILQGAEMSGGLALDALFTAAAPPLNPAYTSGTPRIRYLGHAGLLMQTEQACVVIDPVIPYLNDHADRKFTFHHLPTAIDYVLLTHTHMDHTCLETLLQLRHKIKQVLVPKNSGGALADPSLKLMLNQLGFAKVAEVEEMETLAIAGGQITALPFIGEHADVNVRSKTIWLVELNGKKILAAADASNIDPYLYKHIGSLVGAIDVLFIGMECKGGPLRWLYGALLTQPITREANESRRFNGSDFRSALELVDLFSPRQVYVYALGMEPWYRYFMGISYNDDDVQMKESKQLIEACQQAGIESDRLFGAKEIFLR